MVVIAADPTVILQECEGDCDDDSECATGLTCFQRDVATSIPGCKDGGSGDIYDYDYCYDITKTPWDGVVTTTGASLELNADQSGAVFQGSQYIQVFEQKADDIRLPRNTFSLEVMVRPLDMTTNRDAYIGCQYDSGSKEHGYFLGS